MYSIRVMENKRGTTARILTEECLSFLNSKTVEKKIPCAAANRKIIVQVSNEGFTTANITL